MQEQIVIQACGCVAIPEEIAIALGMAPGVVLKVSVDRSERSITLTSLSNSPFMSPTQLAACPVPL